MKLEFHPEAELELIDASVYYQHAVPGLGERFETEVRRATDLLLDTPEIGASIDTHIRKFVFSSFPYNLIYVTSTDSVCVLARRSSPQT
jgi:plasmid stabilization system protein ParE